MEYAVLAGIIVVALAAIGTGALTTNFTNMFSNLFNKVNAAVNAG
jgi:Flp pilus assembly pilin Flp